MSKSVRIETLKRRIEGLERAVVGGYKHDDGESLEDKLNRINGRLSELPERSKATKEDWEYVESNRAELECGDGGVTDMVRRLDAGEDVMREGGEMLARIKEAMLGKGLDGVDSFERVLGLGERLDGVEGGIEGLGGRVIEVEGRTDCIVDTWGRTVRGVNDVQGRVGVQGT